MLNLFRTSLIAVHFLASLAPCSADPAPIIHYAPAGNLEHIDVALIDRAEHEIDLAAYVLTDCAEREPSQVFHDLAETPGVEIRIKRYHSAVVS